MGDAFNTRIISFATISVVLFQCLRSLEYYLWAHQSTRYQTYVAIVIVAFLGEVVCALGFNVDMFLGRFGGQPFGFFVTMMFLTNFTRVSAVLLAFRRATVIFGPWSKRIFRYPWLQGVVIVLSSATVITYIVGMAHSGGDFLSLVSQDIFSSVINPLEISFFFISGIAVIYMDGLFIYYFFSHIGTGDAKVQARRRHQASQIGMVLMVYLLSFLFKILNNTTKQNTFGFCDYFMDLATIMELDCLLTFGGEIGTLLESAFPSRTNGHSISSGGTRSKVVKSHDCTRESA